MYVFFCLCASNQLPSYLPRSKQFKTNDGGLSFWWNTCQGSNPFQWEKETAWQWSRIGIAFGKTNEDHLTVIRTKSFEWEIDDAETQKDLWNVNHSCLGVRLFLRLQHEVIIFEIWEPKRLPKAIMVKKTSKICVLLQNYGASSDPQHELISGILSYIYKEHVLTS